MPEALIKIAQAREQIFASARPLPSEPLDVTVALDRVLAQDVTAARDVPPFPSSAMDGYAVQEGRAGRALTVIGESRAGSPWQGYLDEGEAVRISTGAAVPAGASAVIRQEDVVRADETLTTSEAVAAGENIRGAGEVMRAGTAVLESGRRLGAPELGIAIAAGTAQVGVVRQPRVSVLCTGDELRDPGEPLGPGEIHNSNGPMLVALSLRCGAVAEATRRLGDDLAETERALEEALQSSDLALISGGVSVGPHDHVKPALARLGVRERFWGVALQPGKPTWFGTLDEKLVFGLPGNPVSAAVTFALFVAPALAALQGSHLHPPPIPEAELGVAVRRNPVREQALRVRIEHRDGIAIATPNGPQGSHVMTSLVGADALALIPAGEGELAPGTQVALEPLLR